MLKTDELNATGASHHFRSARLWLALRLPDLPCQALAIEPADAALVTVSEKRRVLWASPAARALGVVPGMDAASAHILSACINHERNQAAECQLLAELSAELYAFTPYIECYTSRCTPQSGLLLEISRCLRLFKGVKALSEKIAQCLTRQKIPFVMGLAHSAKAAWLLSFTPCEINAEESRALFITRLQQLPIQLLHDYPKQVDALEKTGFVTLGDITRQIEAQSISAIKKRFGQEFAQALCDIFGIDQDFQQGSLFDKPVTVYKPQEFFSQEIQFDYPLHHIDQLQTPLEYLLKKLAAFLRSRQWQTHHIEWELSDIYHNKDVLQVYADTAQSDWPLFFDLTLIQLENRDLPFEVDTLVLSCRDSQATQAATQALNFDSNPKTTGQSFTITAAKLKARLGNAAIYKLSYCDSYIPEESHHGISLQQPCQQSLPPHHLAALRPSWLFKAPIEIIHGKRGLYWRGQLSLLAGPERVQGNWWKKPSARDYFLAQRHDYVRLWVFWDLHKKSWFVQGVFG